MEKDSLPIAEVFTSIHGEGTWAGTRMLFIRMAGCSVGKPTTIPSISPLPIYHASGNHAHQCTSWDGRRFICDTDFKRTGWRTLDSLVGEAKRENVKHVCLTGGEPLIHLELLARVGFFNRWESLGVKVHIETSGTILFCPYEDGRLSWVTVSPKLGALSKMLREANEIRLLIDSKFQEEHLPSEVFKHHNVYVSPINEIHTLSSNESVDKCLELIKKHPEWKFNCQMHKVYGWR